MNINKLPNGLKELALKRQSEYDNNKFPDLISAFDWHPTKEEYCFWEDINEGNFKPYYDLYPAHNWIEDYPGEYQVVSDSYDNIIVAKVGNYVQSPFGAASIGTKFTDDSSNTGIKEDGGKISYELDWEFIEAMAARMSDNKGKYEPYNWKKPIDVEKLKQSLIRHVVEIMKGNYSDDDEKEFGHLPAAALNAMMIFYQLKLKKDEI